jgi:hypothetical protein
VDGAGRLVETLPELAALGIADEGVKGIILGKGRPRDQSGSSERRDAGSAPQEGAPVGSRAVAVMRFVHGVVINTA